MEAEYLTQKQFAERIGISQPAINKAVKAGRIRLSENGRINWTEESKNFSSTRSKKLSNEKKAQSRRSFEKEVHSEDGEDVSDFKRLQKAKADREEFEAKLKEQAYLQGEKELVLRADVIRAMEMLGGYVKASLFSIPERICAELVGKTESHEIHKILMREFASTVLSLEKGVENVNI
jgi:transcriptional regulator with XRE-family HTH domain